MIKKLQLDAVIISEEIREVTKTCIIKQFITSLDYANRIKKTYEKNISRELQHQKINLETVSMPSFGQRLTGLEVRS